MNPDSYLEMLTMARAFHAKQRFREIGGEELAHRVAHMIIL
jgi:hypothetical protein